MRPDQRKDNQMRPVRITTDYLMTAEGSALIEIGHTRVRDRAGRPDCRFEP